MSAGRYKPTLVNGCCIDGCLPLSEQQREKQGKALENAVTLPEYAWQDKGEMPIIKWDAEFDKWLERRIKLADKYAEKRLSLYPWDLNKVIPEKSRKSPIFNWNQGSRPSCAMHGAAHAFQSATLIAMGLGSPLYYEALNPIYSFFLARGGNLQGGLDLFTTAEWVNKHGMYPASLVGDDNININNSFRKYEADAKKWQSGIVFIEDKFEERILKACHALCAINFGAGRLFTASKIDRNGIKVMDQVISGGHAQCMVGYRRVGNEEYVFNINSHGDSYGQSAEGEPKYGAWLGHEQRQVYCKDIGQFGNPYIVFVEGEFDEEPRLYNDFELPSLPDCWKV